MSGIFLDTSGLIACVNHSDQWHSAAIPVWKKLWEDGRQLVTTSLVLIELGDGLSRMNWRHLAVGLRRRLSASDRVQIVAASEDQVARAWELYEERGDKDWGMTDCVSMTVMRDAGLSDVFTLDRHFEQAGFQIAIPRPEV